MTIPFAHFGPGRGRFVSGGHPQTLVNPDKSGLYSPYFRSLLGLRPPLLLLLLDTAALPALYEMDYLVHPHASHRAGRVHRP